MALSLLEWRRGPRSSFALKPRPGVYALFLRDGAELNGIVPGERGLLYIGLAAGRKGLLGRCHFHGRTRNHSPRKSLSVLLMDELELVPILVSKPRSADTWGLEASSEARLSAWMHKHLELAIELCEGADERETELVGHFAPPLNLAKCLQTSQHRRISNARAQVLASLYVSGLATSNADQGVAALMTGDLPTERPSVRLARQRAERSSQPAGTGNDAAVAIAARYHLNPKSYRQRLRDTIAWYRKPQDWTFAVGSQEHFDMIGTPPVPTALSA